MNALEIAIKAAIDSNGAQKEVNQAYLEFLKANFIVPIEKELQEGEPIVLYLVDNETTYLPVFSNEADLQAWANDIQEQIQLLRLSAVDLLKGIGENISIALNPGSAIHKTFEPMEIARLKNMVLKLFKNT